jgi:hypothetical protein
MRRWRGRRGRFGVLCGALGLRRGRAWSLLGGEEEASEFQRQNEIDEIILAVK